MEFYKILLILLCKVPESCPGLFITIEPCTIGFDSKHDKKGRMSILLTVQQCNIMWVFHYLDPKFVTRH